MLSSNPNTQVDTKLTTMVIAAAAIAKQKLLIVPSGFKKIGIVKKDGAPKLYTLTLKIAQKIAFTIHAIQVAIKGFFIRTQIP